MIGGYMGIDLECCLVKQEMDGIAFYPTSDIW